MEFENIRLIREGNTQVITLARPTKLNALNIATLDELKKAFEHVYDDASIKGVLITGEGEKAFAAGADIAEIANLNELTARKFCERGQEVFSRIEECSKPVIAAINGYALGGGCELAMACHIRIAVPKARFGQPEVSLGLIPGYGGTQRLTQLIGKAKAMELTLTGDTIDALEAHRLGLVNHVVPKLEDLHPYCFAMLEKIYTKAPIAVGLAIECINTVFTAEDGYEVEANHFAMCCRSEDFIEGTKAFMEKRPAVFHNR
jgi:enoyl-CoA hydratase